MLENDGFYMLYQPQVDVRTRQLVGFEALARTKGRDLLPGKFIPSLRCGLKYGLVIP